MLRSQSIDAPGIDRSHQIFVHLVLRVFVLVGVHEAQPKDKNKHYMLHTNPICKETSVKYLAVFCVL